MGQRLLGSKQKQRGARQSIVRADNPLLVIDLSRQAQSPLCMRQRAPQLSKVGKGHARDKLGKGFPAAHSISRATCNASARSRSQAARLQLAVQVVSPHLGEALARAHSQAGTQHAAVAHRAQQLDGSSVHVYRSDLVTEMQRDSPQQIEGFGHPRLVLLRFKERQRFVMRCLDLGNLAGVQQPVALPVETVGLQSGIAQVLARSTAC